MAIKKCLIKSNTPQDFSAALSIGGLMIQGSEPANTKRRIVFLVNGAWYKLANNNGTASLVKVPTQNITADSVLNEGNTVAELNTIKSIPPFVGRYVYPAVAMYAADGVTTMPSIRLGFNYTENLNIGKPIGICIDHMGDPANGFKQVTVNGNLLTQEYLDSSAPPDNANAVIAYGVVLNQPGNTYGDWRRIDVDGNDLKITDFSKVWPYNEIKTVTVDGQQMVRIPKIYVNNTKLTSGPYAGKYAYLIAPDKIDDTWHVHPAFIMKGGIPASAVDIGVYEASKDATSDKAASVKTTSFWQNINRAGAITACSKRNVKGGNDEQKGWHCFGIYDYALLARLKLIELGKTSDEIADDGGRNSGTTTVYETYHGIENPFGNPTAPCWLPGLGNIGNTIRLYKNDGSEVMVDTGLKAAGNGWVTNFSIKTGDGFDLGDVFVASAITTTKKDGICSDWQRLARNDVNETGYFTGYRGHYSMDPVSSHGMFAISQETFSSYSGFGSPSAVWGGDDGLGSGPLRFRLAHFVA